MAANSSTAPKPTSPFKMQLNDGRPLTEYELQFGLAPPSPRTPLFNPQPLPTCERLGPTRLKINLRPPVPPHYSPPSAVPATEQEGEGPIKFETISGQRALDGLYQDMMLEPVPHPVRDLASFLKSLIEYLRPHLTAVFQTKHGVTFWVSVQVRYSHPNKTQADDHPPHLHSGKHTILNSMDIDPKLDEVVQKILQRNANFCRTSSGLVLDDVLNVHFKIVEYHPLAGHGDQELPKFLENKKCIINVQNRDNRCFGYAVLAALEPQAKNAERPSKYNHLFARYGLDTIQYPVELEDIPAMEEMLQVRINVITFYDDEGRMRQPIYVSEKAFDKTIDLLYWNEHYAWIKSFPAFLNDLTQNHTLHWCRACLGHFTTKQGLINHKLYCEGIDESGQLIILPDSYRKVKFENLAYVTPSLPPSLPLECSTSLPMLIERLCI